MRPLLLIPLALALPARAQDKPDLAKALPAPEAKNASATIDALIDGVSSRATVQFSAPDTLRFDVEADEVSGSPARSGQAQGAQTIAVEGKRARRASFNGLSQWFRVSNEPLMQALGPWLSPTRELEGFYTLSASRAGEATIIEARASDKGKYLRRDQVRSGGSGAQRFYAARAVTAWNRPARIRLRIENSRVVRREDFAEGASTRPLQTWSWRYENGRPTLIEARDAIGALRAQWKLSFENRENAPAPKAALEVPPEAILEGDAPTGDQAAEQFAIGVRAARSESYAQAVAALSRANELKPRAVAVPLALFEIALTTRNNALAQAALLKIGALEGENSPRAVVSRARLALQNVGANGAEATPALDALAQVLGESPNAALRLQAADLLKLGARRDQAASLLLPLLDEKVPASIAASALARLADWFSPLEQAQRANFAAKIVGASTWDRAARAVLQREDTSALQATGSPELEFVLARQAALAGRDDEAKTRWKNVALGAKANVSEALWLRALLSRAQLAARQDDAASALVAHRAAWPLLRGESARESWLNALLSSWVKAGRTKALRTALRESSLRPLSRATTEAGLGSLDEAEADARLLVAAEEAEGGDATSTSQAQAARWKGVGGARAAWWQGHLAEILAGTAAQAAREAGTASKRERLYDEAARAVEAAITLEPGQPFYHEQKLLLAARRLAAQSVVTDAATGVRDRERAEAAVESLRTLFPNDPDALIASGLALLTMKQERQAAPLLRTALRQLNAPPVAGEEAASDGVGERVARVTARASLAASGRKAGDVAGAMRDYAVLFEGSRSPVEQGAFAANWLNAFFEARDAAGGADTLARVARTGWKPSQTQQVLAQVLASVSVRPAWRQAIRQSLEEVLRDPTTGASALAEGSALIAAYLDFSALNSARRAALATPKPAPPAVAPTAPNAPAPDASTATAPGVGDALANAQAQPALDAAIAIWKADVARLTKLTSSSEPGVAAQALSLLAQDALLRGQDAEAARFFERALERVPSDEGLALSLSGTLQTRNGAKLAEEDQARIVQARDALLARSPLDANLLQQAAQMSLHAGRASDATTLRDRARALAFFDDSVSAGDYDDLGAPVAGAAK